MKNKEKYNLSALSISVQADYVKLIDKTNNQEVFKVEYCSYVRLIISLLRWLEEEYIEPIKLSDDEIAILKNIDLKYEWIVRNSDGGLKFCVGQPAKNDSIWLPHIDLCNAKIFNHLFKFIKWENEEPYNIDELLKMNGAER